MEGGEIIKFSAPSREGDQQLLRHECSRYAIAGLGASISRRLCDIMHISFNLRVQLERVDLLCPVHPIYTTADSLTAQQVNIILDRVPLPLLQCSCSGCLQEMERN